LLSFNVETASERGLLGVAHTPDKIFFYMTERNGSEIRNRVYSYDLLQNGTMSNKKMILDLPGTPGPNHDGGKLIIGPDGFLYVVIGDLNRNGVLQNYQNAGPVDNTSVILRVDVSGAPAKNNPLSGIDGVDSYYAYGIRNSFGIDFDPLTGKLWDTENGPDKYDEINIVEPGFNSGWEKIMGPSSRTNVGQSELVMFNGSHYSDPVFSWLFTIGVTDIKFLDSDKLGDKYKDNIFVGDINNGNLYSFKVNDNRTGLDLEDNLLDRVADNNMEASEIIFGTGFDGGITDIETGPDGELYVLSYNGDVYRIVPAA
jgi:glucose/arabinose dehydrogenase